MSDIHPTAVVSPGAEIGDGVRVGPYVIIGPHARIGEGVVIRGHALVEGWTEVGANAEIFPFASIGLPPQDMKYKGEKTTLQIGEGTIIREGVTLHPGTSGGGGATTVGNNCLFMVGVHIAHDCHIGDRVIMANGTHLGGHVTIEDAAVIGALCGVHQFTRIGTLAMTAAGSMVAQDVPPYCTVHGDRARLIGLNTIGMERNGFGPDQIRAVKQAYRILFQSKLLMKNALARVERELAGSPEVDRMVKFIRDSERGLCR
jgi:UDP-N-acetylglucosamine acyltransferase